MKALYLLGIAICFVLPVEAQLQKPNDAGVAMGQIHLVVKDIGVQQKFWTAIGGVMVKNGSLSLIEIPGTFIVLEEGKSKAGSVGSVINHFGIFLKDIDGAIVKWKAGGISFTQSNPKQAMVTGPDDVLIEVHEDATMTTPIKMHHIHFNGTHASEMRDWYVKVFGATPGHRATFDTANLPGVELAFSKTPAETAPLAGRSLDQIGFEVTSLREFSKRLNGQGLKFDAPVHVIEKGTKVKGASFSDPWGTHIAVTEHLAPAT
jgi:catechol-2,3-dioxygenase